MWVSEGLGSEVCFQKSYESLAEAQDPPAPEQLARRHALVPEEKKVIASQ